MIGRRQGTGGAFAPPVAVAGAARFGGNKGTSR
jgi:hypothetical protein